MEEEVAIVFAYFFVREERIERRRRLRSLRDAANPLSLEESVFVANFRLPKTLCLQSIEALEQHDTQNSSIPFFIRFFTALSFYAHGSYQKCVGNNYNAVMSQSTVSRTLTYISKLIVQAKGTQVRFPQTNEEMLAVKSGFYDSFGIKSTIGAIDCTNIAIRAPQGNDSNNPLSLDMNRKGFYSINVEAVCDHRLVFTAINAKFPGSCHDSGIWTTSSIRIFLLNNYNRQRDCWLLGDQGYPLEPWLLTPFSNPSNGQERKFNMLHAKGRNKIERAFGVLKARFRCLSKHRALHYSHAKSASIINACVILHNTLLLSGMTVSDNENLVEDEIIDNDGQRIAAEPTSYHREGERIRSRYVQLLE